MTWGTDLLFLTSDILSMFIHFVFFNFNLLICVESQVAFLFLWKEMCFLPVETLVIPPHLRTVFS